MTWYLVMRFHRITGTAYRDFLIPQAADIGRIIHLLKRKDPLDL